MTPSPRSRNQPGRRSRGVLCGVVLCVTFGCGDSAGSPPAAEFIVAAGDSTYWVSSDGSRIRVRGSPMVLARLDNRFRELYVVDEDRSFSDALFIGQRLYQRDILTGDSTEIFRDTLVPSLADRYEGEHPEARALTPEEDVAQEPASTATAEVRVLGVYGPFLSLEYHADTSGFHDDEWHMTRHLVVDLRTGRQASLADVLGAAEAATVLARARALYRETVDSVRRDRRPLAQRAAQALDRFRFDPVSFSLTAPNGTLMIAFSAPGQGVGAEGNVLPLRPLAIAEPPWWNDMRETLPSATQEREELWSRPTYAVRARYDTASRPVQMVLLDTLGREFPVGEMNSPVHRIYWLDSPAFDRQQRAALTRAFDEAALYDAASRAVFLGRPPSPLYAARR